jgi:hypothetical protein
MRTVLVFLGVYLLSGFVAFLVGIQLAISFMLREEFIAILLVLELYSVVAIVAFAVVYGVVRDDRWFAYTALTLAILAIVLTLLPSLVDIARRGAALSGNQDAALLACLILPVMAMLLIQWFLLRRRWLKRRAAA